MKTIPKILLGIILSIGLAGCIAFWEFVLTRFGVNLDSNQPIANLFYVGNRWPWNASLGLFGLAFVTTYDRWGELDDDAHAIPLSVFGIFVGFLAAAIARSQQNGGLLGWKGLAILSVFAGLLAFVSLPKDYARVAAMFLLGLAFGIALFVGAAAGVIVTGVLAISFFVGLVLDTCLLTWRLASNRDHRF